MGMGHLGQFFPVPGTKGLDRFAQFFRQCFAKIHRVKRLPANAAVYQIECFDLIPSVLQKKLKLNGILGADSPTVTAPSAPGHIMRKRTLFALIRRPQCVGRTILHAGQTPVAPIIDLKIRHNFIS